MSGLTKILKSLINMKIPNLYKETRFSKNLLGFQIRQKLNKTPTNIIKILIEECEKVLKKRGHNNDK